jgi:hypothetical protein
MALLGDEAQMEACFGPFGDSANLLQDRCTVCAESTIGSEIILGAPDGTTRWCGSWESHFSLLVIVLVSVQDRSIVCAKRTIASEIVLHAPDVLLGDEAQVEAHFCLIWDSANLDTIGLDVILDAPDRTPRW